MDETSPQGHDPNYSSRRHDFEWREPTMRRSNWPVYLLTVALVAAVTATSTLPASGNRDATWQRQTKAWRPRSHRFRTSFNRWASG